MTTPSPPPPPEFVPASRWRLSSYLADVPPRHPGALTLDEVRELVPWGWAGQPRRRLRLAGIGYSDQLTKLVGDSPIWARRAEDDEVQLGELVREVLTHAAWARPRGLGVYITNKDLSWHLPPAYTGSGTLRRWRLALPGDAHEVLRLIRGAAHAPGEELVLDVGASPARVAELVKLWVKGWTP